MPPQKYAVPGSWTSRFAVEVRRLEVPRAVRLMKLLWSCSCAARPAAARVAAPAPRWHRVPRCGRQRRLQPHREAGARFLGHMDPGLRLAVMRR